MPLFDYTGQLQSGGAFQGSLEAKSHEHAEAILSDMGVRTTSLRPAQRTAYVAPLSLDDFQFLNEQVSAMTRAQLPLEPALRNLAADIGSRRLKRLLLDLAEEVSRGVPLDQALATMESRFPTNYAGVVKAGLQTGDLGGSLYGLAVHLRLRGEVRRALIELASYPLFVLLFAFAIATAMMRGVVPELAAMFRSFGVKTLPIMTELVFAIADHWRYVEFAVASLVIGLLLLTVILRLPGMRGPRESVLRALPGVSGVYWSSVLARFTHTTALAAVRGTPLPEMLLAGAAASGSTALERCAARVAERSRQGEALDQSSAREPDLPRLWVCAVQVAGARGELPSALRELALAYEARAQQSTRALRLILGPVLIILVGVIIGTSMLAIILPMLNMLGSLTQ